MGLLDFFSSKPKPAQPTRGGLLSAVPTGATQQAYKDYAETCMVKGQQPMAMADWMKAQQAAQAQQPPK